MNEQTVKVTLTEYEYRQLTAITRRKNMSTDEAFNEAVKAWIRTQLKFQNDPLSS